MALRRVHFIAIGGTGMGSLAGLLKARGIRVTGSDRALYPPMSTALERWQIPVHEGFDPEHVLGEKPDLVVIGNAVRPDNPEARAAIDAGIPYLSFSDALYRHAIEGKHPVVVSGTHGKTTVTSLIATLLLETGREPSFLVGGIAGNFDTSFREASGEHFVVEGDEYDTAFFDKTPKFLHYGARTLVLTSVEFDHADIYRDLEHVKEAFRGLVAQMPRDGVIVAALERETVREVVKDAPCRVVGYGLDERGPAEWGVCDVEVGEAGTQMVVTLEGREVAEAQLPLYGRFNLENALGALATASELGVPVAEAAAALGKFRGVKRRQEIRGEADGVTVIDDFAHHPTAVRGTISAVRERFPGRRLVAVFEPRSNTSRRKVFQREYAESFDAADRAVIAEPPPGPIYSATGEVSELFSAAALAEDLRVRGVDASAIDGVDAIVEALVREHRSGDVVVIMSNGAFDDIWEKLLARLRATG
jgi:UDP-N-acetylmuramate: L-alanyl-gamma-D-glutamyl-meso-diaminopimelate ligase